MIKPLTLSQRLLERADASDEDCRTDDGDIMREADEALKAKDTQIVRLQGLVTSSEQERYRGVGALVAKDSEIDRLRGVLTKLEREATEVSRQGAVTGRQWTLLAGALIVARGALKEKSHA